MKLRFGLGVMASFLLFGCGGTPFLQIVDDVGDDGGAAGDDGATTSGGSDAGANGATASSSNDAQAANDAAGASDGASIDAPFVADGASTAGAVACGASTCTLPSVCCVLADGTATCQSSGAACAGGRRACDEPADCNEGACCFSLDTAVPTAECRADCGGGGGTRVAACLAQDDCTSGTCAIHACTTGAPIESCAPLAPACP